MFSFQGWLNLSKGKISIEKIVSTHFWIRIFRYSKQLKKEGLADVKHRETIPQKSEEAIQQFLAYIHRLMVPQENYDVSKISIEWRDKIHYLCQYGIHYIITTYNARRGNEGYRELTRSHFAKTTNEETGEVGWTKVRGELSKNHQWVLFSHRKLWFWFRIAIYWLLSLLQ